MRSNYRLAPRPAAAAPASPAGLGLLAQAPRDVFGLLVGSVIAVAMGVGARRMIVHLEHRTGGESRGVATEPVPAMFGTRAQSEERLESVLMAPRA
ncbi:MAG: hypothetical protein WCB67_11460 [Solirubrobacteraceae bacterium]